MSARAVVGLVLFLSAVSVPLAACCADASSVATSHLVLPQGEVLSDEDLLAATGDGAVITVLAGAIVGAASSAGLAALVDWAEGGGVSAWGVVYSAVGGAVAGGLTTAVQATATVVRAMVIARSCLARAGSWSLQAAASLGVTAHSVLHSSVRMPIQRAFTSAWQWMTRAW
jgi:hypothetical protein